MRLQECKKAVDEGKTAEHRLWRSLLSCQIRKEGQLYARHTEGYKNPHDVEVVKPDTVHYRTWEELVDGFYGRYETEWVLTNEPFRDYHPPEEAPYSFLP